MVTPDPLAPDGAIARGVSGRKGDALLANPAASITHSCCWLPQPLAQSQRVTRVIAVLFVLWPLLAGADRFVVSAPGDVRDTALLDGEFANRNFGGSPLLEAGFMGGIYAEHRAVSLLRFDLSGVACGKISAVKVRLYKPKCFVQTKPVVVELYEVAMANAGWQEGNAFCATDTDGASWSHQKANRPWAGAPGCARAGTDFGAKPVDTHTAPLERGEWMEFNLPAELVQRWLDDPAQNAGVYLTADASGPEWGEHVYFHSSEHWSGNGPQLVIEGTPGPARPGTNATGHAKTRWALPPDDAAFERWLKADGRLAKMTKACRMNREQARVFHFFDTQVREELILARYQRPLGRIFTEMQAFVAQGDEAGVRLKLHEARAALLTWEYIRETAWYTSGPLADVLSPWQLGALFSKSIFGRLEEHYDEAERARQRESGRDDSGWSGTWQPLAGEKLEAAIQRTIRSTAQRLELTPQQLRIISPKIAEYEREENRYVGEFRRHLDRARELVEQNVDDDRMMAAVRGMHLNHERFLYYQSIFDAPRWNLFMEHAPVLPWGKWAAEVGKRYAPKERPARTTPTAQP